MADTTTIPGSASSPIVKLDGSFSSGAVSDFATALTGSPTDHDIFFTNEAGAGATTVPAGSPGLILLGVTRPVATVIPDGSSPDSLGGAVTITSPTNAQVTLNGYAGAIFTQLGVAQSSSTGGFTLTPDGVVGTDVQQILENSAGANTVVAGAGEDVIFAAASSVTSGSTYILGTSGTSDSLLVEGATADTVIAGSGQAIIFGGSGSDVVASGSGPLMFVGGTGASTVFSGSGTDTLFGEAGSNITFAGSSSGNTFVAGAGNETLNAIDATGSNVYMAGSGNTLFNVDPTGNEVFGFVNGLDGGSDTISGFGAQDQLNIYGGSTVSETSFTAAGTQLTLSDGTKILLQGYLGNTTIQTS